MHGQTTCIHRLTRLTMAQTWRKSPPSPYSILCDLPWRLHPNDIFPGTPKLKFSKISKLGFPPFWMPIISCADLWLRRGLKQSCNPHWKLFNNICHVLWTHVIQDNHQLLMVRNQIDTLSPNLSFNHNLCCKYLNQ
jgi:hypothetical protein